MPVPIRTNSIPMNIITSLGNGICPARAERPMKLVSINIKGPTKPKIALILKAFSGVLKYKNNTAAESSINEEINLIKAMDTTKGFIYIPLFKYTDYLHWAF
jgi:hypothetical protein